MLIALALCAGVLIAPQKVWAEQVPSSGRADPRLTSFDALMTRFLRKNEIPGAALAVSREGRLVYSRGFGYAELDEQVLMQPDALFRIASLSKPVTSATVFLLAQAGKLKLDDPVLLHIDPKLLGGEVPRDSRWADITIRDLLQHHAGFDRAISGDSMFAAPRIARYFGTPPPPSAAQIVEYMLSRKLDFDPGARTAYSNFGFCLLGRVIERCSGESYESAVRAHLLAPLGVTSMRIGKSSREDHFEGEVRYYTDHEDSRAGRENESRSRAAYGRWNHPALDAAGGWLASAPDLLRFLHLFDGEESQRLLSADSIAEMFARPAHQDPDELKSSRWYACGWQVFEQAEGVRNVWHTGSLPGTETLLVRRADALAWAVLFNARDDQDGQGLVDEIDSLLHVAAREVQVWPEFDLFTPK